MNSCADVMAFIQTAKITKLRNEADRETRVSWNQRGPLKALRPSQHSIVWRGLRVSHNWSPIITPVSSLCKFFQDGWLISL